MGVDSILSEYSSAEISLTTTLNGQFDKWAADDSLTEADEGNF